MNSHIQQPEDPLASFAGIAEGFDMAVVHDHGLYRHLVFTFEKDTSLNFEVVTWPGSLQIKGGLGAFSFSRLDDMFAFFRGDDGKPAKVNPRYWAEKCVAHGDGDYAAMAFTPNLFRQIVREEIEGHPAFEELDEDERAEVWEAAEGLFSYESNVHDAFEAVRAFECNGVDLSNFFDQTLEEPTYAFLWNCAAIAHAVCEYDKFKLSVAAQVKLAEFADETADSLALTSQDIANLRSLVASATPVHTWKFRQNSGGAMVGGDFVQYARGSGQSQVAMMMGEHQEENGRLVEALFRQLPQLLEASARYVDAAQIVPATEEELRRRFEDDVRQAVEAGLMNVEQGIAWDKRLGGYAASVFGLPPTTPHPFNDAWLAYSLASNHFCKALRAGPYPLSRPDPDGLDVANSAPTARPAVRPRA